MGPYARISIRAFSIGFMPTVQAVAGCSPANGRTPCAQAELPTTNDPTKPMMEKILVFKR
jgi:hypothetical protein